MAKTTAKFAANKTGGMKKVEVEPAEKEEKAEEEDEDIFEDEDSEEEEY